MKPFKLEVKDMINIKKTAFQKCPATQMMRYLIKQPDTVIVAMQNTNLRFTLIPQNRRVLRLG